MIGSASWKSECAMDMDDEVGLAEIDLELRELLACRGFLMLNES